MKKNEIEDSDLEASDLVLVFDSEGMDSSTTLFTHPDSSDRLRRAYNAVPL